MNAATFQFLFDELQHGSKLGKQQDSPALGDHFWQQFHQLIQFCRLLDTLRAIHFQ